MGNHGTPLGECGSRSSKAVVKEMTWCLSCVPSRVWDAAEVSQVICWFSISCACEIWSILCHNLVSPFNPSFISFPAGFSYLTSVRTDQEIKSVHLCITNKSCSSLWSIQTLYPLGWFNVIVIFCCYILCCQSMTFKWSHQANKKKLTMQTLVTHTYFAFVLYCPLFYDLTISLLKTSLFSSQLNWSY